MQIQLIRPSCNLRIQKRGPEGPQCTFNRDRSTKGSDRSRGDGNERQAGEARTSSFASTGNVVQEQSSSCNTRFSIIEGDSTRRARCGIEVTAVLNTGSSTVCSIDSNHEVLRTGESTEAKSVLTICLTEVIVVVAATASPEK